MPRTVGVVFGLSILFTFIDCKCSCLPTKFTRHLVIPLSKGLIAVDSQVSGLPKKNSHFSSLAAFSSSSYSSPSPIAAAENPSTWSRVTETKGETTIEHISDFIAALASRRKGWKIKLFPKPVERIAKTSFPRARFIRHWFLEIAHASRARYLSDWQDPPECWQYCQNWPIRGYSSSCYTRRGSLKKFLQALPPRLALVLPRFFLFRFRSSPTTESLEQARYF